MWSVADEPPAVELRGKGSGPVRFSSQGALLAGGRVWDRDGASLGFLLWPSWPDSSGSNWG